MTTEQTNGYASEAQAKQWSEEIRRVLDSAECARGAFQELDRWLWNNIVAPDVLPRQMPEPVASILNELWTALERVRSAAHEAFDRYSSGPLAKVLSGHSLTRDEYHIDAAMGGVHLPSTKDLGLSPVDEYEAFFMLRYEDEDRRAYVNPWETPHDPGDGRIRMRFGISPEEARLESLRPEQREFFQKHLPDVYARVGRGTDD